MNLRRAAWALALGIAGCSGGEAPAPAPAPPPAPAAAVPKVAGTFEEFRASLDKVGEAYIVNGDMPIHDEKQLREFFERLRAIGNGIEDGRIVRYGSQGLWPSATQKNLSYCVSTEFGERHAKVVKDMRDAAAAWQQAVDVRFAYLPAQDADCTARNARVVFNVVPTDSPKSFYAIAFFPHQPRKERTVLVFEPSFQVAADDFPQLVGVLRHELGHVLGFRHEFVSPHAGPCVIAEDRSDAVADTPFDRTSVMNYPDCSGEFEARFELTETDKSGAACNYGPAPGFTINPALVSRCSRPVAPPANAPPPLTKAFAAESVAAGKANYYGPFTATPGTAIGISISAANGAVGDADLYVRLGQTPAHEETKHDCRPFISGSDESCELGAQDSPRNHTCVMVYGKSAAQYALTIRYVPPPPGAPPPPARICQK